MDSVIGKQIKKYRAKKGITQEQLGNILGVTTQAVSKWERGGTPDAELLPGLATALDVSIDALFGRDEKSIAVTIARHLCQIPSEEAYQYAFGICWALEIGLFQEISLIDDFMSGFIDNSAVTIDETDYFSKLVKDGGIADARLSTGFRHFFLMVEPQGGLLSHIGEREQLRRVFEIFADDRMLKIIYYLYSRLNTPIDATLISKNTGLDVEEVERCMEILSDNNLADRTVIHTAGGEIHSYMFRQESSVIPLLCFADEIRKKDFKDFMISFDRTIPLLQQEDVKD